MISCIVIEDEPLAIEKLVRYIEKLPTLQLLKTFSSAVEAIPFLKANSIDIIFLDIEMKELTGIQLLESINIQSKIIITTAYDKYALKGYELKVSDYLLKPISFERFIKACDKVIEEIESLKKQQRNSIIFIKTEYRLEGIHLDEIFYIEGMGDYRQIVTYSKKIMTLQNFGELQTLLADNNFCRVHNSYIVSIKDIQKIEKNRIYIGEKVIPISQSYSSGFYAKLNKH